LRVYFYGFEACKRRSSSHSSPFQFDLIAEPTHNGSTIARSPYDKRFSLQERLEIEKSIFHWLPYKRIYYMKKYDGTLVEQECPERNPAINEFPKGWWTRE
jgi:hypothetical protein